MTVTLWLGTYLLHSTVLCGAVLLLRKPLRRVDGAESLWRAAVLLPVVSATLAQCPGLELISRAPVTPFTSGLWTAPDVLTALATLWLLIGALLVLRDGLAHWMFVRKLGTREPANEALVATVTDLLHHPLVRRPIRLTCASVTASPIVLGSEICLPARALRDLPLEQFRAVVAHEVAHIVRRDGQWFSALAWLESALFVQPLNRIARRELHHLAELACDEWAARELADPRVVADCLVEVAGWSRSDRPQTVPAAVGSRGLTHRVHRLLEPRRPAHRLSGAFCVLTLTVTAMALPRLGVPAPLPVEQRSVRFLEGYALGRAYAGRRGTPVAHTPSVESLQRRADIERQLQTRGH